MAAGVLGGLALAGLFAGCFRSVPPAPPAQQGSVVGIASWYGPGFDGRRTASGEVYDQEDLTAASRTLPLGTHAMVTNLDNGRAVEVRINDRGPYVKGRAIDLSHRAAKALGLLGPGTGRVRIDVIGSSSTALSRSGAAGYAIQVGAFSEPDNAEALRDRLADDFPDVRIERLDTGARTFYRVRIGSFDTRRAAVAEARAASRYGVPAVIVAQ